MPDINEGGLAQSQAAQQQGATSHESAVDQTGQQTEATTTPPSATQEVTSGPQRSGAEPARGIQEATTEKGTEGTLQGMAAGKIPSETEQTPAEQTSESPSEDTHQDPEEKQIFTTKDQDPLYNSSYKDELEKFRAQQQAEVALNEKTEAEATEAIQRKDAQLAAEFTNRYPEKAFAYASTTEDGNLDVLAEAIVTHHEVQAAQLAETFKDAPTDANEVALLDFIGQLAKNTQTIREKNIPLSEQLADLVLQTIAQRNEIKAQQTANESTNLTAPTEGDGNPPDQPPTAPVESSDGGNEPPAAPIEDVIRQAEEAIQQTTGEQTEEQKGKIRGLIKEFIKNRANLFEHRPDKVKNLATFALKAILGLIILYVSTEIALLTKLSGKK